ncbi:MAG: aminotransferase class IV [Candidatus Caenarcaniphilales bacterium]|nr:aminotransferase class IV [Candidatus Caenarcaniphilales bacterium]
MIPIDSETLRYGLGCFETIKVYPKRKIAFLDEHIERLLYGIQVLNLEECLYSNQATLENNKNLDKNNGSINWFETKEIFIKQTQSFVEETNSQKCFEAPQILRLIFTKETGLQCFLIAYKEKNSFLKLMISNLWRVDSECPLNQIKSFNYLKNYFAHAEAKKAGFDDSILLNEKGEIVEASKANIFFRSKDGDWLTPSLESGCLPGIIRGKLIRLLNAKEEIINANSFERFESCFVCNSLIELQKISSINDYQFRDFNTSNIKKSLRNLVGLQETE